MKLTAKELRIGNLFCANGLHEGKIMELDYIGHPHDHNQGERVLFFVGSSAGEFIKDCSGVPLTKDLLLRSGFTKANESFLFYNEFVGGIYQLDLDNYDTVVVVTDGIGWYHGYYTEIQSLERCEKFTQQPIKYYHELQNLVYALTKVELELKPE